MSFKNNGFSSDIEYLIVKDFCKTYKKLNFNPINTYELLLRIKKEVMEG